MLATPAPRLTLVHLYPELMNVYGDRGNILTLVRRCQWRGIDVRVESVSLGDSVDPATVDLLFFGGGQDREQEVVAPDLVTHKASALREAAESDAVMLLVCGGYQLMGKYFRTHSGGDIPGIGVLDAWTVAGKRRLIGNCVVRCDWDAERRTLVGFENHSGKTYLGPACQPLGTVLVGSGNTGEDRREGAIYRNVFGCYLHGSLLPKNPWFADELILRALRRRHGTHMQLEPLDDRLELEAHDAVVRRSHRQRGIRSGAW
jgi:lipid II isoglutaminyl synthase (glutamine-hydrolysing)